MFEKYLVIYTNNHHVLPTNKKRLERDRQRQSQQMTENYGEPDKRATIREMKREKGSEELKKAKSINKILYFKENE